MCVQACVYALVKHVPKQCNCNYKHMYVFLNMIVSSSSKVLSVCPLNEPNLRPLPNLGFIHPHR